MHAVSITAVSPRFQHPARRAAAQQAARRPGPVRRAGRRPRPVLLSEETPSLGALAPPTVGGSPVLLHIELRPPTRSPGGPWTPARCGDAGAGDVLGRTPRRPARPLRASLGAVDRPRTGSPDDIAHRTPPDSTSTRASWRRP